MLNKENAKKHKKKKKKLQKIEDGIIVKVIILIELLT